MKKLTAFIILTLISLGLLYSTTTKICISPYDAQLAKFLSYCDNIEVVKAPSEYSVDMTLSLDEKLLSYIKDSTEAEYILIPQKYTREGLNFKKIHLYSYSQDKLETLYTDINQLEEGYAVESIISVLKKVSDTTYGLIKIENLESNVSVSLDKKVVKPENDFLLVKTGKHNLLFTSFGNENNSKDVDVVAWETSFIDSKTNSKNFINLKINSNVKANVVKDSVVLGQTPFVLDSYTLPTFLRLRADGYADFLISVQKETKSINAQMRPAWMQDGDVYKKAKDDFYLSFARSILLYGAKVVFQSLDELEPEISAIGIKCSNVLMTVSIGDLVYKLINYSRYAHYISP